MCDYCERRIAAAREELAKQGKPTGKWPSRTWFQRELKKQREQKALEILTRLRRQTGATVAQCVLGLLLGAVLAFCALTLIQSSRAVSWQVHRIEGCLMDVLKCSGA
jgi:hypothetical protein